MTFYASAPATLMLMGEHAVLHKKHCLVCAVDQRIEVNLKARHDTKITIHSALGNHETDIEQLEIKKPFQFVLGCLLSVKELLENGCDIHIESDFSEKLGLGSSAAVTVAMIACLHQWLKLSLEPEELILHAREIVRKVQGLGSGADVAASILGGIVLYRTEPFLAERLLFNPRLCAVYSGSKMPTREVIDIVEAKRAQDPKAFDHYFNKIEAEVLKAYEAIQSQDWQALAESLKANQKWMQKLGVSNAHLENIIQEMEADPGILAAKISGSGLGDCIIGLGKLTHKAFAREIPIKISKQGVIYGLK